jgi:hypothetical protein
MRKTTMRKQSVLLGVIAFALIGCMACSTTPRSTSEAENAVAAERTFTIRVSDDRADVLLSNQPFTSFHFNSKWDKPFLHPVRTMGGVILSRGYPVDPLPQEEQDHPWHRGIWFGHGDINGEDFWREKGAGVTSKIVLHEAPTVSESSVDGSAVLTATAHLQGAKSGNIGTVNQSYTFRAAGEDAFIDVVIGVAADRSVPLRFGDTDDGGFGVRLRDQFRQDHGARLINSEGLKDTENIWGKPAKWVCYSAEVDGKEAGVAVFDHPTNLRHPTTWHARGYGLFSANPFALQSFTGDKTQDGSYTIEAGDVLTFRYRVVIREGHLTSDGLDKLFAAYAESK